MRTNKHVRTCLIALPVVLLLTGCRTVVAPPTVPSQEVDISTPSLPVVDTLQDATYTGILPDQPITLTDGMAYYSEEGPGTPFVQLIDQLTAAGDLDGDGVEDVVGLLVDYTTGSADFVYLAALLSTRPGPAEAIQIGDRTPVKALAIVGDQVVVDYVGPGPGDAACCPTWNIRKTFEIADGRLVERSSEALSQTSLADLVGTNWRLISLGEEQPSLLPDGEITLQFEDGQINGFAGCNSYSGPIRGDDELPQVMAVGPLAVTAMMCEEDITNQETTYLDALSNVVAWRYDVGFLALTYRSADDELLELGFAPNSGLFCGNALAASPAQELPPATIAVDEGGADFVTGEWNYSSYAIASHFLEPVVALMNFGPLLLGDGAFVPRSEQFLGLLTSPISPSPATFRVNVPKVPTGAAVDVDNDGEEATGVQIYLLIIGTNLVGDSYLEQVEQGGYSSALFDPQSGALTEGTLLVYAPDDAQGFPSSAGEDGVIFTADDPAVVLPAGYTLVSISSDGDVTFDRSSEAIMNTLEPASSASPDFSDQGILESFNSLIDMLAQRYSYTELRGLDWEEIRQSYLPQVEAADAADSLPDYYMALNDMALSIRDAHVEVTATDPQIRLAPIVKITEMTRGTLGAGVVELSDGRVVVTFVDPEGPGAEAGWVFGTEIISVDGVPISERVDSLPFISPESTAEGIRLAQIRFALAFPAGTETTVEYKLPGSEEIERVTLTAGEDFATAPPSTEERAEISFKALDGGFGYIQWGAFDDPTYKLAMWEKFLSTFNQAPGLVIDLRDNGGGNIALFETMVSYFFPPNSPAQLHWIDYYVYDEESDGLVREYAVDSDLVSPNPSLTYDGAVVVLVNENSASAAEYFPQFLQHQGRALVVGEHGTDGAGGIIERAALPSSISFQFTKGRTVFAGTQELNLEAKGVTLDVRVPVTEAGEQAKLDGGDPVLDAALVALSEEAARRSSGQLTETAWQWVASYNSGAQIVPVENLAAYTVTFGEDGVIAIQADCNQAQGEYTLADGAMSITVGPATLAACPDGGQGEQFLQLLTAALAFEWNDGQLIISLDPESGMLALVLAPVE